ncbi:uncharacterized protein LOC126642548 [Myiozetetes cayanensis]|uniref:uncharacterized protein LOC126642548 n=1 Tax=Myiozetetes cayanensis TaxID=478635 RepID=UPI002160212C|nr:uncharacterized protein LOC126642548 [Myiozetetes cayanensis]
MTSASSLSHLAVKKPRLLTGCRKPWSWWESWARGSGTGLEAVPGSGQRTVRILEVTTGRSPQGLATQHLLPSSPRPPAVSSIPVLPKPSEAALGSTRQALGIKDPPERGVQELGKRSSNAGKRQHGGTKQLPGGQGGAKPTYIKLGCAGSRWESPSQPPRLPWHTWCPLLLLETLHLRPGLPGRSRGGCGKAGSSYGTDGGKRTGEKEGSGGSLDHRGEGGERGLLEAQNQRCQRILAAWKNIPEEKVSHGERKQLHPLWQRFPTLTCHLRHP